MCGIIGINENNKSLLNKAGLKFNYRGPDATAFFCDEFVTLGHHRLSIIDLDSRSTQPMSDSDDKIKVVFNGEIYNFQAIKDLLKVKYDFRTTSDTEVIIYAYKEWGIKMVERLQGMFAIALYDSELKQIFLIRDHRGIKPLYYYAKDGYFVFASELKGVTSVLRDRSIKLKVSQKALDLYFSLGYIPAPYSLYEGVFKVSRSSYLVYDLAAKIISQEYLYQGSTTPVTSLENYFDLIEKKILDHLVADVPVGVFFSGGTDSSLIAAVLHKYSINLETFSIKLNYKTEDYKYFSQISSYLNLKSHVYDFNVTEFEAVYEEVMSKLDEPTYDNSIFPTYFVSKKAAQKVKVVLSGEGGDEFFLGYPRSAVLYCLNKYRDYHISLLDRLFFILPSFKAKNRLFEKLFIVFRQPFSFYLMSISPTRDLAKIEQWRVFKQECVKRKITPVEIDQEFYLEGDLLRKIDLATSYVSIEGRVPLLDIDIIKNSENFDREKLKGGVLKALLKGMLAKYIPNDMVYRNKSGFGLDMVSFFQQSAILRSDFNRAMEFLKTKDINLPSLPDSAELALRKYPHLCFAYISLYRSLVNNEL